MGSLLRILPAFLLMTQVSLAKDLEVLSDYVLKHTESCPDVGYYFRREPVPNTVGPGPCYLCFCQRNSTAACWLRKNSRCDVEKFHHHRVGRSTRARRSPAGLSDIFFRDATRDFFDKQLPEQCKPYESSFSDGCPPADWCVGCTVCDCDANGRWDCHILSFCNGDERKNIKSRKVPLPKMPTRRVYHQGQAPTKTKVTLRPKKIVKKSVTKPLFRNKKPKNTTKKPNKNTRKSNNNRRKSNENTRNSMNNRKNQHKVRSKTKPKKTNTTRKPQHRRNVAKKPQKKTTRNKPPKTTRAPQKKQMRKKPNTATEKPQKLDFTETDISKMMNARNEYDQSNLGRRIIRKVMSTVQKMIAKQVVSLQNATRVQRSINGRPKKDCQKNKKTKNKGKKKAKLSYKELREQKLKKYKKQYNFRKKRHALDLMDLSVIELKTASNVQKFMKDNLEDVDLSVKRITKNVTVFDAGDLNKTKTEGPHNINSNVLASNTTAEISTRSNKPLVLRSNISNIMYYQYSFDKNESNVSFTTELVPIKDEINKTTLVLELVTEKSKNITGRHVEKSKKYAIITSNPEFNDIKYQKWDQLKILRDKDNSIQVKEALKFDNTDKKLNDKKLDDSSIKRFKYKIHREDIKRKLDVTNKYNLKKIISSNFKTANYIRRQFIANETKTNYNISNLQNLLRNLMKELKKPIKQSKQTTKFGMFKYMRNMFRKLFSRRKGVYLEHKTNEGHTLEILCENIGACFMNNNNRIALRAKIHDLNKETAKIFRTIKMIKGLLYLIEMPINKDDNTTKKSFHDDIRKLDAILKGTYANGENSYLSETQGAQIGYVKENIYQFIESVGRFATILNEILEVLYKNNKKYSCQRNLRLSQKKKKLSSLNKIKNLLIKYNIVQNTFMKKMYILLTDVEKNTTTKNPKLKVSDIEMNNPHVIDTYSKNIIENLRRLKNLALALNYSRKKRQTMREDDAIEYLLVLMEYLLKQNHPLDTAPVNDGIDLLIEAIQNAPDIKPIQKKIINSLFTTPSSATRTTSIDASYLKEDSISDSNRISKEESKENDSFKNENELAIEQVIDDEKETTQIVYYKKFEDSDNITVYSEYDTTTEFAVKTKDENTEKGETGEKTGFDRFESAIDETRKYEVYASDLEDEAIIPVVTMSTTEKEVPSSVTTKVIESSIVPLLDYKLDDDTVDDKKTKLEWIEENFGKEIREYRVDNMFNVSDTTISLTSQVATTIKPKDQSVDNISSITVELEDEEKKKKSKAVTDEVLYRKQIEFLNSLDYGTERSEFDDPDSKDDEKYSGDGFPSYFVK